MVDTLEGAGNSTPANQPKHARRIVSRRVTSRTVVSNLMGRTERALRMALGGALIMALAMCDIPTMHYSFKYVGPFLFFVAGTLAPPFLSSAVIIFFSGLFCILLACGVATALLACLLVVNGGKALCIVAYTVTVAAASFLTVGKTKEMTLIGSYIMLYATPLATLIASAYAYSGISLDITPEKFATLRQFLANSSLEQIKEGASHFLLIPPESIEGFLSKVGSPSAINFALAILAKQLQIPVHTLPEDSQLDPKAALDFLMKIASLIPPGKPLAFETKVPRNLGLNLTQGWMYDVPLFVEGVTGGRVTFGARPGPWFIQAIWVASGSLGILRNVVIFAFLGFAVYLLAILVPPIRRQRDVAVREMAAACSHIRMCLGNLRQGLEQKNGASQQPAALTAVGEGKEACDTAEHGPLPYSESSADTPDALSVDVLDSTVMSLMEIEKAVLVSGMEPFLLYPGPGVFTLKHLSDVRMKLIDCCVQTQHLAHLLRNAKKESAVHNGGWSIVMPPSAGDLLAKSVEMYELCEKLLTTFPSIFNPSRCKKQADDIMERIDGLESELRSLALEIFRPLKADKEKAALQETQSTFVRALHSSDDESVPEGTSSGKFPEQVLDCLPLDLASIAFVDAVYSEPVQLGRCISTLSRAQQINTLRGLLMNLVFPFVPVVVHFNRIFVAPLSSLAFWRLTWRGPDAWWRKPESWYAVKLVIVLVCLFSCGICLPEFSQYSWGVDVTESPIFLDMSVQGVTTRMVPWFALGFLTVLQTTYNGTVHRALARTIGILLGAFFAWAGLKCCESNLAALISFCSLAVFVDIFIFVDPDHPLDGFHRKWGYSGVVFTYTQVLIVTLGFDEMGGMTGCRDYLVTTRILSNLLGIILAVILTHLPPLASATTSACTEYSHVVQHCIMGLNKLTHSFLCVCGDSTDEHCTTPVAKDKADGASFSVQSEQEKVYAVRKMLDSDCKEHLGLAASFSKEGRYVPLLLPWRTSPSLTKAHVAVTSIIVEAQDVAQLVLDLCDDHNCTALHPSSGPEGEQELVALPFSNSKDASIRREHDVSKSMNNFLISRGNCLAVRELFQTSKGKELREALRIMCDSISTLSVVVCKDLCASLPAFGDKLMCRKGGYAPQRDSPGYHQAYESCRAAVDSNANRVNVALVDCLGEHSAVHREARLTRMAAAFVVMRLLYHLQSVKFRFDEIHTALLKE